MTNTLYDVLILGGGPAGLTAAIYTSRANLKTLVIAGQPSGGQLILTTDVENFPGFPQGILGPELITNFKEQANRFGAEFVEENAVNVTGSFSEHFTVETIDKKTYTGKTIIIATGASAKWLNLESEQRLIGHGVSACATCDAFFFKNKTVVVVGGGDVSMEDSLFLTKFCTKVHVLVRGTQEKLRASKYMVNKALNNPKIEFHYNSEVVEVLGTDKVTGLKVLNNITQTTSVMNDIQGLFVAIGHKPNTEFLASFVKLGKNGYVEVTDNTLTSVEGVFVAGDVSDFKYRQAITAAGMGCMASIDVERLLAAHGH